MPFTGKRSIYNLGCSYLNYTFQTPSVLIACRLELQNTLTASLPWGKTPSTNVLKYDTNILTMRFLRAGPLGNDEYPSMPSLPGPFWPE